MQHRLIRIGLAALLFIVVAAPAVAKAIECCCGPQVEQKAKSCCDTCRCEVKQAPEPVKAPLALLPPVDLDPGLSPLLPTLQIERVEPVFEPWIDFPQPASNSPPEEHHSRAPPLFRS